MALILEVLDGRGGVRQRVPLDGVPLRVGRALDNDIVLDDPYVDPRHARVHRRENGDVVVEDLGSVNGLLQQGSRAADAVAVSHGSELRVGRTGLRFRDTGADVAPALPDRAGARPLLPLPGSTLGRVAFVALALALMAATTWLASYERSAGADAFAAVLAILALGGLWAGGWAIASRIVVHRFQFWGHMAVFAAVVLAGVAWGTVSQWAAFLFPDSLLWSVLGWAAGFALLAFLLAAHLRLSSTLGTARRWGIGLAVCGVIGLIGLSVYVTEKDTFTDIPTFSPVMKPFPTAMLPTLTPDEFGDDLRALRVEVDELAARPLD